jgi:uncharacterized protein HemX
MDKKANFGSIDEVDANTTQHPLLPKSNRIVHLTIILVVLGTTVGGGGYIWHLLQERQASQANILSAAIIQTTSQYDSKISSLQVQLQQQSQELQSLQSKLDQVRAENLTLKQDTQDQLLILTGDLQPLKSIMELQNGEKEIFKGEMKLLHEDRINDKNDFQKQQQEFIRQLQEQRTTLEKLDIQLKNIRLNQNGVIEELDALKILVAKGGDVNAFPLAEVDYLLRMADTKLKIEHNISAACLILEVAQQRLKIVDEITMSPIKTIIRETINTLYGVYLPDFSGLAHKIFDLEKKVSILPIRVNPGMKVNTQIDSNAEFIIDPSRSWWESTKEAVWRIFKDIVIIRRVNSERPQLISIKEESILRTNLALNLESMRISLLRGDAQSYQDSLEMVNAWLNTHFDLYNSSVTEFINELKALKQVQFETYIPDLTTLNQAFQEVMIRRQPIRSIPKSSGQTTEKITTGGLTHP